jgi:hypothetical protein
MDSLKDERARIGEAPSDDPVDRLRHTLRVFEELDDEAEVLTATRNVYGDRYWTGITFGDLRQILDRLEAQ